VSLDINSIGGFPQASAYGGIKPRQISPEAIAAPQTSQTQSQQVTERSAPAAADHSRTDFSAAAKAVAAAISESDPMKPFAEGVAKDLGKVGNDVFAAMGQINDLQNALSYALESSSGMINDPALEALS